jgi:hypothetical protein
LDVVQEVVAAAQVMLQFQHLYQQLVVLDLLVLLPFVTAERVEIPRLLERGPPLLLVSLPLITSAAAGLLPHEHHCSKN